MNVFFGMSEMSFVKHFKPVFLSTLLAAVAVVCSPLPTLAAGPINCSAVLYPPQRLQSAYGNLKPTFRFHPEYKVLVPDQSDILNQCSLGTCHLYSWVSLLEQQFREQHQIPLKISTDYLAAREWLRRSLELLEKSPKTIGQVELQLGADVLESRDNILSFGIIPEEAWTGRQKFETAPTAKRVTYYVQNIVARTRAKILQTPNEEQKKLFLREGRAQIEQIFANVLGPFPGRFTYEGRIYNPTSFQKTFFPELNQPLVKMQQHPEAPVGKAKVDASNPDIKIILANVKDMEIAARALLDRGINVYLSYEDDIQFIDGKTGIMSISAFDVPPGGDPLPRKMRYDFAMNSGAHAVQIVGYDFDPQTNQVLKWKIKNSWGTDIGDKGYFHMYNDYFEHFVIGVSFFENPEIPLPEIIGEVPATQKN